MIAESVIIITGLVIIGEIIATIKLASRLNKEWNELQDVVNQILEKTEEEVYLTTNLATLKNRISTLQEEYDAFDEKTQRKIEIYQEYCSKITSYQKELEEAREAAQGAFEKYFDTLEVSYQSKEKEFDNRIILLNNQAVEQYDCLIEELQDNWKEKVRQLEKLNSTIEAANESIRRAELEDKERAAYQICISDNDLSDAQKLLGLCANFNNPRSLRMVVWQSYFQKATNELCTRVKANNAMGIYKLTNLLNGRVYIGQARSISDRWKTHIKCGLGIDTPVTNILYKAMMKDGIWNFSFEVLEECSQTELNECERKWIAFFESDTYGYNGNKGVSK